MVSGRRYFILPDALPKSHVPHMIGRVVEDKLSPLRSFAPFDLNPNDVLPEILPEPLIWRDNRDFVASTSDWSIGGGIADVVSIERAYSKEKGFALDSPDMKQYSLPNTMVIFQKLMDDHLYCRDVHDLLRRSRAGHAYFVTGFLTANQGSFSEFSIASRKLGLEVKAPIREMVGSPMPLPGGTGNPQISEGLGRSVHLQRSKTLTGEVIFAVSYDVIRSSRSLNLDSRSFLRKSVINTGPKRARSKHLAFGQFSDDSDESDFSEGGDPNEDGESHGGGGGGKKGLKYGIENEEVSFMSTDAFWDGRFEDRNSTTASFQLSSLNNQPSRSEK